MDKVFKKLNTPQKIQDYLDKVKFNFETKGETYRSPLLAYKSKEMHCFEGALFALACLKKNKYRAYLIDLKTNDLKNDADHVVVVFRQAGGWGAISKTNHALLRYRDPIYPDIKTLAYSYFHEYFLNDGKKTLVFYSEPFDVFNKFGKNWLDSKEDLDEIALALDKSKHYSFYKLSSKKLIRRATKIEIQAGSIEEFNKKIWKKKKIN